MVTNVYIRPLLKWWRLIVLVTALAVIASGISTMFQPDIYISRTTLVIGTTFLNPNPDAGQIYIAQQLAQIYADMAQREPIQVATMDALGISRLPAYQARVVPNTQMVEIAVTDTNPQRAQIIANELASQLKQKGPAVGDTETGVRQDFIKEQLSSLQVQIQETEKNIEELQKSVVGVNSASQIANIERQIAEQTQKLNSLQANYANFLANSQEGAVNILNVVEPANLPTRSVGTNKFLIMALAGMVGFSLGSGAAYLLEYLDKTVKNTSDVERIFKLPVIGYISEITEHESKATYIANNPNSILAENFRLLRSNIEFFRISNPIKAILITSPSQGNGKTTVASNLALSISQGEQDVILVDADLRRPALHSSLNLPRTPGLSDVIKEKMDLETVTRPWNGEGTLNVITAGDIPPNVTEVIGSKRIATILTQLREQHELIIIDAPPLIIADAYNLASQADGVIIVIEPGKTTTDQAKVIKEQLDRAGAKILGIVFNKVSESSAYSHYDYQYQALYAPKYYGDYLMNADKNSNTEQRPGGVVDLHENGKVPAGVIREVESAIAAIKTQPRKMLKRAGKPRKKKNDN